MTKVRRGSRKGPLVLSVVGRDGKTELQRILAFFRKAANKNRSYKFKAFDHVDVRRALEKLFNNKCAYCETKFLVGGFGAIEHFRPKAYVEEEDGSITRPGYYWLAVEWTNLFLSCSRCNTTAWYDTPNGKIKLGKGNRFPILRPKKRVCRRNGEQNEERLLIDPTVDTPSSHLAFDVDGLVTGRSPKGWKSIEVFALSRRDLVEDRRDHATQILGRIRVLKREYARYKKSRSKNRRYLDEARSEVMALLEPNTEYREMARQVLMMWGVLNSHGSVKRFA